MAVSPISDVALKALKPKDRFYKVSVGGDGVGGLHVAVFPSGAKVFKLTYHFGGKEKLFTIGRYGEFSLAEARDKAREAKRQIAQGEDPSAIKKQSRAKARADAVTFHILLPIKEIRLIESFLASLACETALEGRVPIPPQSGA